MRGCGRQFCPKCNQELIHRDNRAGYESASTLGQIVHRIGPSQLAFGDIDAYAIKWIGTDTVFRILEHKQPEQKLGWAQHKVLSALNTMIRYCAGKTDLPNDLRIKDGPSQSGVYLIRGRVTQATSAHKECEFDGDMEVMTFDDQGIEHPASNRPVTGHELFDWLNCGPHWSPRGGLGRQR